MMWSPHSWLWRLTFSPTATLDPLIAFDPADDARLYRPHRSTHADHSFVTWGPRRQLTVACVFHPGSSGPSHSLRPRQ